MNNLRCRNRHCSIASVAAISLLYFTGAIQAQLKPTGITVKPANHISITSTPAKTDWNQPTLLIPQLPAAPQVDGVLDAEVWNNASRGEFKFPLGSNQVVAPDARFRAGHRDGILYLFCEYDRRSEEKAVATAGREGAVWNDDGGELFFSRIDDIGDARQLLFNLGGARTDIKVNLFGRAESGGAPDPAWNADWMLACAETPMSWTAEFAIPLKEVLGFAAQTGDAFRFNFIRNRVRRSPHILHWAPTEGSLNARPESFGFAVLTGPDAAHFGWRDLAKNTHPGLIFRARQQLPTGLTSYPLSLTLFQPTAASLNKAGAPHLRLTLKDKTGRSLHAQTLQPQAWPQALAIAAPALPSGTYRLEIDSPDTPALRFSTQLAWQPAITVEAEDRTACHIEGNNFTDVYPRSVGQEMLWLSGPKASVSVTNYGRAVYLTLPPAFADPGPSYGALGGYKLSYRIDNRPWQKLAAFTSGRDVALAEDLAPGRHTVTVEPFEGPCAVDAFRFTSQPLSSVSGSITANDYSELLTDVRADVLRDGKLIQTSYTGNPINGKWSVLGLAPGRYTIRLSASGWLPREIKAVSVKPGQKVNVGVTVLSFEPSLLAKLWYGTVGYGRTACVTPGDTFATPNVDLSNLKAAHLVSRYKTVPLQLPASGASSGVSDGLVSFRIPPATPYDMYLLRLTYASGNGTYPVESAQAVCVREALPEAFHIAGVGHMNTWGQQTSEYLAKVAATAELAGARTLLIANEVNPVYIAGALKDLSIPYIATSGNHTMARWDSFFGPRSYAVDDGPLRFVAFNDYPNRSWRDVADLFSARSTATNRVLVTFEAFAPIELIRDNQLDLLFDGHSEENHPARAQFPPGTLQLRAPNYQTMRWMPMSHEGLAAIVQTTSDVPSIYVPRDGAAPLRAEYASPNNGTAAAQTVRLINQTPLSFEHARLRLLLRANSHLGGIFALSGGKELQSFVSDDGKIRVIDVEVAVAANSVATVLAVPPLPR